MDRKELQQLWTETLQASDQTADKYDRLAQYVVEMFESGDIGFKHHIENRFNRVTDVTGQRFDGGDFDLEMAWAFIADEIGFPSWDRLIDSIENPPENTYPILFQYAIAAMRRGDFSMLESMLGGPECFHRRITEWHEKGLFVREQETLNEIFSASCMLGHARTAEFLLDLGVDPYAGMRTGLAGPHYAASSGRREVVKMILEKQVPLEVENGYGGTVLGQALWSAINEHTDLHAEIIQLLIEGGAHVWPGTLEWWEKQGVPSQETKKRIREALRRAERDTMMREGNGELYDERLDR